MDRLKRYIDCYIPTETCNLRCHYCYITQKRKFNNQIASLPSPQAIRVALSRQRLGGICLLNFCAGGETLIAEDVIPMIRVLLEEGHYVMVVTNGTMVKRFEALSKMPQELTTHLFFKFSFHYLEFKRLNLLDTFFHNIEMMRNAGCSFTVEITPSDELIPYIDEIKKLCMERLGTLCHITIARDDRTNGIDVLSEKDWESYKKIWGQFQSDLFDFKTTIFYKHRNEFCYAGDWSVYVNLGTGDMRQCYCGSVIDNIYKQPDKKLRFSAVGTHCSMAHCYNGHAFLTLGVIPELNTITYDQVRNRTDNLGREWLQPEMKSFMSQKLADNNEEYSPKQKRQVDRAYRKTYICSMPRKLAGRLKRKIKEYDKMVKKV